jgi:hypothetical protein
MFAEQALYRLSHTSSPFFSGYFGDGGLTKYLPRMTEPQIHLISASQVARIIGVSQSTWLENLFKILFFQQVVHA